MPWFQRLEMMEEDEGELPSFQQFGTKVLAVMKPPPEAEQPPGRVSLEEAALCFAASEQLHLPWQELMPSPDSPFPPPEAPVTRGDPPALPLLLLPAEDKRPGKAAW